jgi:anaerobic ribonucleoside-triphosphate reductase activating protein
MRAMLRTVRMQDQTAALGPGIRAVVWFHGCALNCQGCIAKEMNESNSFTVWSPTQLAERVLSVKGIEGVTLSGGDPFDQSLEALWEFIEAIKKKSDLTILSYTGRTLSHLRSEPNESVVHKILSAIDILIDGPYVESLNDGSMWRGSSNQKVHFMSARYSNLENSVATEKSRKLQVNLNSNGDFDLTGIPPVGFLESLQARLLEKGLLLRR